MSEPSKAGDVLGLGNVVDMAEMRERLRSLARSGREIADFDARIDRIGRMGSAQSRQLGVNCVHDSGAIDGAGPIDPDESSRQGIEWARQWTIDRPGAVVWGGVGSGKTTLLCRLLGRIGLPTTVRPGALGYSVCLASVPRMLAELSGRQVRGGYAELLDALGRVDVLALDDLGVGVLRRGWAQHLWAVLDSRWSHGRRPLLITSNIDPAQDRALGLRWETEDGQDVERALDRMGVLAPTGVRYDSPASRRGV